MIPCTCINAKNKPNDIPKSKWVKEGEQYHITYTVVCLPQNVLAFSLYEKPLDETCYPYEYFISTRFGVKPEDIEALMELVKDCTDTAGMDINELMKNSNLINQ
jgi:hypothetical protein